MGRPPTALGTYGAVSYESTSAGRPTARVRYRDYDGKVRRVSATGKTKAAALAALKTKLRDRQTPAGADLSEKTRVSELSRLFIKEKTDDGSVRPSTIRQYEHAADAHVVPALGELRLMELRPPVVDLFLRTVAKNQGHASAKVARSVLSGMCGYAVRAGALPANPVREASRLSAPPRLAARSKLDPSLLADLRTALRADDKAVEWDLPDLVDFLASTGCRIGEAMAIRASRLDLDAEVPTCRIDGTVVRLSGKGVAIQEVPKSQSGERTIPLSPYIAGLLRQRIESGRARPLGDEILLFPSPLGHLRDGSNTSNRLKEAFKRAGSRFDGITPHTFRRYVLTTLDANGFSARQAADLAGHANVSMTQNVYFERGGVHAKMADTLDLTTA
jgi:integrase